MALICLSSALAETVVSPARAPISLLVGIELAGLVALVLAMALAWPALVVPAVGAVAISEGASLALAGPAALAPILGAALLAGAELAFWSIEAAVPASESASVQVMRTLRLLAMCLIGCLAGLGVSAVSAVPIPGGFDLTALGIVAGIGILVVVIWLGRSALGTQPGR